MSIKTIVIHPGETVVIKKNMQIIKVINDSNVTVSSSCPDLEDKLNGTAEALIDYYFAIELQDELLHGGGTTDYLTGVGMGSDFYPFTSRLDASMFQDGYIPTGAERPWALIQEVLPGASAFLRSPTYEYNNWAGPSGGTSRDNVYRAMIKFKSFTSIVEDQELYLLFENTPTVGTTTTVYKMRIYPARLTT